jgi:hypothetical protein
MFSLNQEIVLINSDNKLTNENTNKNKNTNENKNKNIINLIQK